MSGAKQSATPDVAPLYVTGVGLVSPAGFAAADHAFFVRAGVVQPVPSPFLDEHDQPLPVLYCPWLPPTASLASRIEQLAFEASSEALQASQSGAGRVHLNLVTRRPSPEFTEIDVASISSRLREYLGVPELGTFHGAAGAHLAIADARRRLESGSVDVVCIVGADSWFSVPLVQQAHRRRKVVWLPVEPPPSEAAGAIVLASRRLPGSRPLAKLLDAGTTQGTSSDLNDEPVDGVGLTFLFRKLPNRGGVPMVFGPVESERTRQRDWNLAAARARRHLGQPYAGLDVETAIGQVGAAAGCVHIAYAVTCNRYQTVDPEIPPGSPFYAWAMSADGLRGLALFEGVTS